MEDQGIAFIRLNIFSQKMLKEKNKIYKYDGNSGGYLQRCSHVVVICMVSPVTRCSTTFANNDTT